MTLFGQKFKSCVDNNKINAYQLAKKLGIERTTMQKIKSEGRLPNVEYVQKLINAMPISPYERDELWTAYTISKDGEMNYNQKNQEIT